MLQVGTGTPLLSRHSIGIRPEDLTGMDKETPYFRQGVGRDGIQPEEQTLHPAASGAYIPTARGALKEMCRFFITMRSVETLKNLPGNCRSFWKNT